MQRKVYVLQGVSGSGKSTLAEQLAREVHGSVIVSADTYFYALGGGSYYRFDPSRLGDAHGACLRSFVEAIQADVPLVLVDNTNASVAEIAPYMALAQAYKYEAEILRVAIHPAVAAQRTAHSVPEETIRRMADRLDHLSLPPWWPVRVVSSRPNFVP